MLANDDSLMMEPKLLKRGSEMKSVIANNHDHGTRGI